MNLLTKCLILAFALLMTVVSAWSDDVKNGPPSNVVTTNQLRLTDSNGKVRAALTMDGDDPILAFIDSKGRTRAFFALYQDNPILAMKDKDNKVKLSISIGRNGSTRATFGNKKAEYIYFLVDENTGPVMFFSQKERTPRLSLGIFDDQPSIGFWQKDKKVRMAMGLNKDQEPLLWLADQNGRPDLSLGRHEDKPQINLTRGQSSVALGMVQGDEPYIFVKHGGKVVWKATGTVVPDVSIPDELMRFERPKKSWQEQ